MAKSRDANHWNRAQLPISILLIAADMLAVAISFLVAYQLRAQLGAVWPALGPIKRGLPFFTAYWPIVLIWPVVLWREGLYPGLWLTQDGELRRLVEGTTIAGLIVVALTFVTQTGVQFSRPVLVGWWAVTLFLLPFHHIGVKYGLSFIRITGEPVVVLGVNELAERIVRAMRRQVLPAMSPLAYFADDVEQDLANQEDLPVFSPMASARDWASARGIRTALIVMPELSGEELVRLAEDMGEVFQRLLIVPDLYGLATVQTDVRDMEGVLALEVRSNLLSPRAKIIKRGIELLLILLSLPLVILLTVLIAAAQALEGKGSIFYSQKRIGRHGDEFKAWKFRTMVENADQILAETLAQNAKLRQEWELNQKLRDDPRLTRVGKLLRRLSLDELPQLWNVVRGEMSLVGPRPIVADEIQRYGPAISLYYQVRPGITGQWQVSGRSDLSYPDRVRLDAYYVRNWSVWLDLVVLLRTFLAVLTGRGAY